MLKVQILRNYDQDQPAFFGDISFGEILKYFIISLILVVISDVSNNMGILLKIAQGILALLLFTTFLLPIRPAMILLTLISLAGKDIVSDDILTSTASIWQFNFGPVKASWLVFGCIAWQFLKMNAIIDSNVKRAAIWFATVPIFLCIINIFLNGSPVEQIVIDLKFAMMLLISIIVFQSVYRVKPESLFQILCVFIGALLARHLSDLIYVFLNLGPQINEGATRGSLDSAKGCIIILIYIGILLVLVFKRFLSGILMSMASVLLLAVYGTRELWITFIMGLFILLFKFNIRRYLFALIIIPAIIVGGVYLLFIINPESAQIIYARSKTITEGREENKFAVNVQSNVISRIDPIRFGEILNILHASAKNGWFLWGTGYGGYYKDEFISFPPFLMSSFPDYSLASGKFYRAHFFLAEIFLKHGIFGSVIILLIWVLPGMRAYHVFKNNTVLDKNNHIPMLAGLMLCIVSFLITAMFQLYWSGKGLFINGLLLAACTAFCEIEQYKKIAS
jgi:hypothetical protein